MPANTDKPGIRHLAKICKQKGISQVVLSPGSRCAPIVIAFLAEPAIECIQIVDERSAAFFALGLAQQSGKTVALVCTSGSAVLNYAPAVAEAYYQKIPLLLLTADRPNEWIDQGENQSINQYRIYNNYIKASLSIPANTEGQAELWYSDRMVSEAINLTRQAYPGPVHLNIPLREPLYNTVEEADDLPKLIDVTPFEQRITDDALKSLAAIWNAAQKKMIVVGGLQPNEALKSLLKSFAEREDTVVLTESISNLPGYPFLDRIDPVVELISDLQDDSDFIPEILISLGGGLVSKKLKFLLRKHRPQEHWHITDSNQHWDTFQSLTKVLNCHPQGFLSALKSQVKDGAGGFHEAWHKLSNKAVEWTNDYLADKAFSDFKVFEMLIPKIPKGACLHLGNSTPVRYANLFSMPEGIRVFSNRGISGIDGVVSTAAGASHNHKDLTVCVTGDLGFFYDSNAWWNQHLKPNFRAVLINNGGGNIFRIIPGPNTAPGYPEFYEAPQEADAEALARAFGVEYDQCADRESTDQKIDWLLDANAAKARILEVKTSNQESAELLRNYLSYLKSRNNE